MKEFAAQEVSSFCELLGLVVKAGMPLQEGLEMMQEEVQEEEVKVVLQHLVQALEADQSFVTALVEVGVFPMHMIEMMKIGFETGRVEEVLGLLASYYQREDEMRQSVRRVLLYPLMLLGMMCTVILIISTQVLPVFESVLEGLGMQMSQSARGMMKLGTTISEWSATGILVLLLGGLALWGWMKLKDKRDLMAKGLQRFKSYETFELQKFTSAMTLLIGSGVQPEYAMEMARELIQHQGVKQKVDKCVNCMQEGQSLGQAVQETGLFSSLAVRMLVVGSRTGCLEEMMTKLAAYYEEETEETLDRIVRRIEPIAVIILAIVIGSILLSVMLPLMSMMSVIG